MKIGIITDSHDHILLMVAAAKAAVQAGAEAILHCGDVVAPSSLQPLNALGVPIHVIHGNNTGDLVSMSRMSSKPGSMINYYGQDAGIELAGKRIFLVHYPHYARAMATTGDWDIVCCGHSHKTSIEKLDNIKGGTTQYIDAGTVGGVGTAPASWILGDLDSMTFTVHELDKSLEYAAS
ncbi:metallophosphoesterase family protein [Solemya velum gill symbiont]|uniref:Phosphoesterase n=4 Tax=Solemya velum gill symbiont TaxID=2340 RepID=A0A0B0HFE0_SOVGS|nr:metallophosphoesterase family protein [Solemya velum gill symbiont]KHF26659.1 phosphoesterase [Solemya velum gill symbiont]OOY36235.1 YfcE family phosphodiesterase [Solemya velum gill symbiont]OOY45140.1 YfcE family phosphodiesterase [Solemya velum gill symbiont]OOY47941.1 YfcE family phosphodiesterase [Solemya velum gill symbiont]OOY50883.1 YfcE family phosphodiesterase [Solemya velum gill symbiont]